jgi:putative hydrolase of the HAD superfamily
MTRCTAFVFDIDDTLYLEQDYVRSGFQAVGEWVRDRFGCDDFGRRCWAEFEAGRRRTIFNAVLAELGLPSDAQTLAAAVACYREHQPGIRLLADAEALLTRLHREATAAIAFISDGPLIAQRRKAEALGLSRFSDTILLTDAWGRDFWKPHSRAFATVERLLSLPSSQCVYIADNPDKDFHAPRQRGWRTVRIRRAEGLQALVESAPDARPDAEVSTLDELPACVPQPVTR